MPELCAGFKGEKDMDFEGDAVVAKRQSFPGKPTGYDARKWHSHEDYGADEMVKCYQMSEE